ncbi:MAG: DUF2461 domain-containing protein [Pirellulaceae bacterium]
MVFRRFEPTVVRFLEDLRDNNNRQWFQANKDRYEREVREPCLSFIRAFGPQLRKISPFFVASDERVGGSLMRIYRDTRFGKDKTPYKTNVGIQFRHELGGDVHAPGFYIHIEPDECFLGLGAWRPDRDSLHQIRQAILERPEPWKRALRAKMFRQLQFTLAGDSLKRPPRDCPVDHALIADLKRTDYVALRGLEESDVFGEDFLDCVAESFAAGSAFMRFLCVALNVPY